MLSNLTKLYRLSSNLWSISIFFFFNKNSELKGASEERATCVLKVSAYAYPRDQGWKQKHLPRSMGHWHFLSCVAGGRLYSWKAALKCKEGFSGNDLEMTFRNIVSSLIHRSLPFFGPQFPIWTLRGSIKVAPGHGQLTSVLLASTVSYSLATTPSMGRKQTYITLPASSLEFLLP